MLTISNLSISYGERDLFRDISVQVGEHDRVGLVGVNGAGKSTLLKIMAGETETDRGVVQLSRYATTGYLPQEIAQLSDNRSLYQEAESAFGAVLARQAELADINQQLATTDPTSPAYARLIHQQGELQALLDQDEVFGIASRIEKVLLGLGFQKADFDRPCLSFSGGWLMRLMLAKLLLSRPSYLLLDEPTNHLDIESLAWLEDFLRDYRGAVVLISHDRAFLDALCTATWEISLGQLHVYRGNYSRFVEEKKLRMQVQQAAYDNQQTQIQQTMRFVERFRAKSTKAKQVQSRLRQLSKIERIELEAGERSVSFSFPPAAASGRVVLVVEHLQKGFDGPPVLADVSFELERGDKLAVVGVNGAGKSTLVKTLAGILAADGGLIRLGHNVGLAYFGQHQAQELSPALTVLETLARLEGERSATRDRTLLAAFLFRGDDVDKKVGVLSGGEKSRLALARMIATPANLLVMDEPTNHLDMNSQEVLQEAMRQYDGSIVVVSHNRYFLDSFINKVLVIKNGSAELQYGNLSQYLERTRLGTEAPANPPSSMAAASTAAAQPFQARGKELRQQQAKLRQEKITLLGPIKKTVIEAEKEIATLETRKKEIEAVMADPSTYKDSNLFSELGKEYAALERRLERSYGRWQEAQETIEKLEQAADGGGS